MFHRSAPPSPNLLLLSLLLLMSANVLCLHGNPSTGNHSLQCVNDYLFTIDCVMSVTPSENSSDSSSSSSSYWLIFTDIYDEKTSFVCVLTNMGGSYFCSVKTSHVAHEYPEIFNDLVAYNVSLCHDRGHEFGCDVLEDVYTPFTHIKPNAPCCLGVSHNASGRHFTWRSTYEAYEDYTMLVEGFQYQLHFFKTGDQSNNRLISHYIDTDRTSHWVDDGMFAPGTRYTARVRTSPNMAHYKGQWSDWSSEVHFKTRSNVTDLSSDVSVLKLKVFIPLCVLALVILLLCYLPVKKWKQSASIPTPAPYFHTLYSECQGDFKRWVRTHERAAGAEASPRIDGLIKSIDIPEEEDCQHRFRLLLADARVYNNINDPVSDESTLCTVTTVNPASAPGYRDEGDSGVSGCLLYSDTSPANSSPWYCNEYCTSSAFTAEHQRALRANPCLQKIIREDAFEEAYSGVYVN